MMSRCVLIIRVPALQRGGDDGSTLSALQEGEGGGQYCGKSCRAKVARTDVPPVHTSLPTESRRGAQAGSSSSSSHSIIGWISHLTAA